MDSKFIFLFLFASVCCVYGQFETNDDIPAEYDGFTDAADIYYPCKHNDRSCMRSFLQTYTGCKNLPCVGSNEPTFRKTHVMYVPTFNITAYYRRSALYGLEHGRIESAFVNKKTSKFVMSIYFDKFTTSAEDVMFAYHRIGDEPVVTKDSVNGTYSLTITAVSPVVRPNQFIQMDKTRFSFYVWKTHHFSVGDKLSANPDPQVRRAYGSLMNNLPIAYRERFLTSTPTIFWAFMQKYICDFGIPIEMPDYLRT